MVFEAYVAEIQKLAEASGATEPGKPYCEPEIWMGAFDDGLTPPEAWGEEMCAVFSMIN